MPQPTNISTSGGLISAAFIENIRQERTSQRGTRPDTFALPWTDAPASPAAREQKIAAAWELLLERWDANVNKIALMESSQIRDRWLLPLFRALDFQPVFRRGDTVIDDSDTLRFNISHFGWEETNDERGRETNDEYGTMNDESTTHHSSLIPHHSELPTPPPIHTIAPTTDLDSRPARTREGGRSPKAKPAHDMLQLFLNLSRPHRWGIVTNGLRLRLLRDYHHTYTKGYVEFDLESIFETRNYADFRALYRMAHASRFIITADDWDTAPLEIFYRDSLAAGVQVGTNLQKQVRQAIEVLGNGLLTGGDPSLRQALQSDPALTRQFYAELLHIIYRILFLLYAEQRGMVPRAGAPLENLYRQSYSLTALRAKAEKTPAAPAAFDLWEGLKVTFRMFQKGAPEPGIFAYNGMLFATDQTPMLNGRETATPLKCRNADLLRAIRALTTVEKEGVLQRISYADLNVEEIGGIYESLLDFSPRVTPTAETVDGRNIPPHTFFLDPRGTARKTSGSYYTHPSLVNTLIESALLPVVEKRLQKAVSHQPSAENDTPNADRQPLTADQRETAESAILSLKICDPAMGSGHFLIAANNALALRLAQIRTGDDFPAEKALHRARRDVLAHCIYGVDLNPMAVELAKVALWINAAVDNAPLSFLDHHLKYGNSLIGATPNLLKKGIPDNAFKPVSGDDRKTAAALKKRNRTERKATAHGARQRTMWTVTQIYTPDPARWNRLTELAQTDPAAARAEYARLQTDTLFRHDKFAANLWATAFFWQLTPAGARDNRFPTEAVFREFEADGDTIHAPAFRAEVARLTAEHRFFHWHLEFPDVFQANDEYGTMNDEGEANDERGTMNDEGEANDERGMMNDEGEANDERGMMNDESIHHSSFITHHSDLIPHAGFDIVLGNPPWERIKLQEKEFFADRDPAVANAANAAARKKTIAALAETNPALFADYRAARRAADSLSKFLRDAGKYPLTAVGDINTYPIFAELGRSLRCASGRVGLITPTGIATESTYQNFFKALVRNHEIRAMFDFQNTEKIFPEVDSNQKFILMTIGKGKQGESGEFVFGAKSTDDLNDDTRKIKLSAEDFALMNPNTLTCPIFHTRIAAEITKKIYHLIPILIREQSPKQNPWGVSFLRMFDMSNDSRLFRTRAQLEAEGFTLRGNRFEREDEIYLPLYEAKMIHQFDHRFASVVAPTTGAKIRGRSVPFTKHQSAVALPYARNYVNEQDITKVIGSIKWFVGFRGMMGAVANVRTMVFSVLPRAGFGNSIPIIKFQEKPSTLSLCGMVANFNSFVLDFVVRHKISGVNINFFIAKQLPVIPPERYTPDRLAYIVPRVLELTYTAWDLRPFADDVWAEAGTNDERRTLNDESTIHHSSLPHHSALQNAILRQWEANKIATGGHAGATPPDWAENIRHSQPVTRHSPFPRPPFKWDEERRAHIRAELDGLYGHLYGLSRDELAYILDTFPIVRRKDEAKFGEYRTKGLVLAAYDKLYCLVP